MKQYLSAIISLTLLLSAPVVAETKPKYGPAGQPLAVPLSKDSNYFKSFSGPTDFWRLIPYYVGQISGATCSISSVTMILNAARSKMDLTSDDPLIAQATLIKKVDPVKSGAIKMGSNLFNMRLEPLRNYTEAAFQANGFPNAKAEVWHAPDTSAASMKKLVEWLEDNEKSENNFLLANFNQIEFTADADVGHIAPVGAYDSKSKRVLIFDPDREWYEPYWVGVDTFLKGLATLDSGAKAHRGLVRVSF